MVIDVSCRPACCATSSAPCAKATLQDGGGGSCILQPVFASPCCGSHRSDWRPIMNKTLKTEAPKQPSSTPSSEACCSPSEQTSCCEPSEKASCCPSESVASGRCGCR